MSESAFAKLIEKFSASPSLVRLIKPLNLELDLGAAVINLKLSLS